MNNRGILNGIRAFKVTQNPGFAKTTAAIGV